MSTDLLKTISRVRRAMPRNADVMEICDALEQKLSSPEPAHFMQLGGAQSFVTADSVITVDSEGSAKKFDKTAYMRGYMRKRRAQPKD